jgi:hypothetical protein
MLLHQMLALFYSQNLIDRMTYQATKDNPETSLQADHCSMTSLANIRVGLEQMEL